IGCKVKEARTAQEALKILDQQPVDILLADVGLPGVSGLQLARDVHARRPDLPVVLATGDSGVKSEAARLGAIVIVKPYTPASLRQGLEHAMKKRWVGTCDEEALTAHLTVVCRFADAHLVHCPRNSGGFSSCRSGRKRGSCVLDITVQMKRNLFSCNY